MYIHTFADSLMSWTPSANSEIPAEAEPSVDFLIVSLPGGGSSLSILMDMDKEKKKISENRHVVI